MIIENSEIKGAKSELSHLDEVMSGQGFVRWQWEYYRATYDYKLEDREQDADYFLRINARVEEGKLESPYAVLNIEDVYIGKDVHPFGVDYNAEIPKYIMDQATKKLSQLKEHLT